MIWKSSTMLYVVWLQDMVLMVYVWLQVMVLMVGSGLLLVTGLYMVLYWYLGNKQPAVWHTTQSIGIFQFTYRRRGYGVLIVVSKSGDIVDSGFVDQWLDGRNTGVLVIYMKEDVLPTYAILGNHQLINMLQHNMSYASSDCTWWILILRHIPTSPPVDHPFCRSSTGHSQVIQTQALIQIMQYVYMYYPTVYWYILLFSVIRKYV